MDDDENLCLCFHVTKRKVRQYIRVHRPKVASQLSQCYSAGTGCGWCIPYLQRLLAECDGDEGEMPDAETYAAERRKYRQRQREQRQHVR